MKCFLDCNNNNNIYRYGFTVTFLLTCIAVFVIIIGIINLSVDVGKLPNHLKYCVTISIYFGSVLALYYHLNNLQWAEIHCTKVFDAIQRLSKNSPHSNHLKILYTEKIIKM